MPLPVLTGGEPDPYFEVIPGPEGFTYLIKLLRICGAIADTLNTNRSRKLAFQPLSKTDDSASVLSDLQTHLLAFYVELPQHMLWSADNYKARVERNTGVRL